MHVRAGIMSFSRNDLIYKIFEACGEKQFFLRMNMMGVSERHFYTNTYFPMPFSDCGYISSALDEDGK